MEKGRIEEISEENKKLKEKIKELGKYHLR